MEQNQPNPTEFQKAEPKPEIQQEDNENNPNSKGEDNYMLFGMCIGLSIGLCLGQALFDNMAIGMCLGLCIGMAVGSLIKKTPKE